MPDVDAPEQLVAQAFVAAADTLGDEVDVAGCVARLASGCHTVVPETDCGVLARDLDGTLRIAASSPEHSQLLERIVVPYDDGPVLDSARSGTPVTCADLRHAVGRWPSFANAAIDLGFLSVQAVPMHHGTAVVGAVQLLGDVVGVPDPSAVALVQALADVATIGILLQRATVEARTRVEQLEGALASRVTIEQAKGMLAATAGGDPETAFETLRRYARGRNARLTEVASAIVERSLAASDVVAAATS